MLNGPNYIGSSWDRTVSNPTNMASFVDGTSNTAIFSEWIKGTAVPTGRAQDGLAEVYNLGENSNFYTTDFQFCRALQQGADHERQPAVAMEG